MRRITLEDKFMYKEEDVVTFMYPVYMYPEMSNISPLIGVVKTHFMATTQNFISSRHLAANVTRYENQTFWEKQILRKNLWLEWKIDMEDKNMNNVTYVKFRSGGKSFIGLLIEMRTITFAGYFINLFSIRMNDNTIVDALANQIEREATPEEVFQDYMESQ